MSEKTTKAAGIVDSYYNQEFLQTMIKPLLEKDKDKTTMAILKYLLTFKDESFYVNDKLLPINDAIFNNPKYSNLFKDAPLNEIPEGEPE
jgi:hypothetical protein